MLFRPFIRGVTPSSRLTLTTSACVLIVFFCNFVEGLTQGVDVLQFLYFISNFLSLCWRFHFWWYGLYFFMWPTLIVVFFSYDLNFCIFTFGKFYFMSLCFLYKNWRSYSRPHWGPPGYIPINRRNFLSTHIQTPSSLFLFTNFFITDFVKVWITFDIWFFELLRDPVLCPDFGSVPCSISLTNLITILLLEFSLISVFLVPCTSPCLPASKGCSALRSSALSFWKFNDFVFLG